MIYLYTVSKHKTNVKGFWKDDKGKIYVDNIYFLPFSDDIKGLGMYPLRAFNEEKQKLFNASEKTIFYNSHDKAFIENKEGNVDILRHKITWHEKSLKASYIKALLENHNGLTIYKDDDGGFIIELWKA